MAGFIEQHSVWGDEQKRLAADLGARIRGANLRLIRLAWADPHGASRAKSVTVPVFLEVLKTGYNINVATTTLDSAGGRVFASFTLGGGMGLDEMTGSPNLTIVPDPTTFRVLPWAPGVGWILCDEYFNSGLPFHFSPRQLLKKLLRELRDKGFVLRVGLEVEWYLARVAEESLNDEHIGVPGLRGRPIRTTPAEPGYSYHSESNMDLMQPVLSKLAEAYEALGLPLRSIENEWGPGQVECTFSAQDALRAADDLLLFRTATRQLCRRQGHFATFMARPALKGYYASGWHLHQSLVDALTGENRFMPSSGNEPLSDLGKQYLGGLLANAVPATVFATPTVNGYRRFKPNSLAPDRAGWAYDHRGTMVRALGGAGDPATRLENRLGEPAANPYLFIASQIVSGLDGMDRNLDPGPQDKDAYAAERTKLPTRLTEALDALDRDALFRKRLGDTFINYYLKLKGNEAMRFGKFLEQSKLEGMPEEPTEWEQNEYFDFF
ncbi:MAG: glutamine synthetase [Candidatus Parcubacteria bacterium]|nr:glutamine synthetase [Burkholderiales bacterium]